MNERRVTRANVSVSILVVLLVAATLIGIGTFRALASLPSGVFLNPSDADSHGPGTYISDKNDGTDSTYHFLLQADTTNQGASVTSVRIQIEPPGSNAFVTVGNAQRRSGT